MAKICPITKEPVLYLDCLECDTKDCLIRQPVKEQKEETKDTKKTAT